MVYTGWKSQLWSAVEETIDYLCVIFKEKKNQWLIFSHSYCFTSGYVLKYIFLF